MKVEKCTLVLATALLTLAGCGAALPAPEVGGDYDIVTDDRWVECDRPPTGDGEPDILLRIEEKAFNAIVVSRCSSPWSCTRLDRLTYRGDGVWTSTDESVNEELFGSCVQHYRRVELVAWEDGELSLEIHKIESIADPSAEACDSRARPFDITCEKQVEITAVPGVSTH